MVESIDPYTEWLGLPPGPRPPHLYALLGLEPFTENLEAVLEASRRQMACIKPYEDHPEPAARHKVQEIMNQIGMARAVLRDPAKKADYDRRLSEHLTREGLTPPVKPAPARAAAKSPRSEGGAGLALTIEGPGAKEPRVVRPDPKQTTLLGRDASCTVQLEDRAVKPRHARIYFRHGRWYAAREDSAAEIVVNGQSCTRAQLAQGDVIAIGPFQIRVGQN